MLAADTVGGRLDELSDEEEEKEETSAELLKTGGQEEQVQLERREKRKRFEAEHLRSSAGLKRIYEEFPETCRGDESEVRALGRLLSSYQRWAFQLYPGLSFEDLLSSTETLCSKKDARDTLVMLRDRERNRFMVRQCFWWLFCCDMKFVA